MLFLLPRLVTRVPAIVKREALLELFRSTAAEFGCDMVSLSGQSWEECLRAYARFTAQRVGEALGKDADLPGLQSRLYANAYRLGRTPGRMLGVRGVDDVMAVSRLLYGVLDIDFSGKSSGEITVGRCFFSAYYSRDVCRVMSAMDSGLLAGLAGGGTLTFSERITEGAPCCRAQFHIAAARKTVGG